MDKPTLDAVKSLKVTVCLCVYCGESVAYGPSLTDDAILAVQRSMIAHDAVCEKNPLRERIATLTDQQDRHIREIDMLGERIAALEASLGECVTKAAGMIGTDAEMAAGPNHGVVLAALDWLHGQKATLEADVADGSRVALDLRDEADKWRIHANALRDALEDVLNNATCSWYEADGTVTTHAPEVVVERRKAAARQIAAAEAKLADTNKAAFDLMNRHRDEVLSITTKLADERRHVVDLVLALEETRCTCEAVFVGGRPTALKCVKCRTLEAHAARRAAEVK